MSTGTKSATKRRAAGLHGFKAEHPPSESDENGYVFEAIVSVFNNVDFAGDRIVTGAFSGTLDRWKSSGDPIPVIWSHQWDNLDAHVGAVLEAREVLPGDPMLAGTGLEENGGLWTKNRIDAHRSPFAFRLAELLHERRIREFSFAYDVLDEARGSDGANELLELDVIEVGPTLKGMNPATRLLAKALETEDASAALIDLAKRGAKTVAHAFAPSDEDESRCILCGLTRNTVAHNTNAADGTETKAQVPVSFEGSIEDELEAIFEAGLTWARGLDVGEGGFYALHQEATYPDELRAIVLVEGWEDPIGEGVFYELTYERGEEGELSVADASELEVAVDVRPKARTLKHRSRPKLSTEGKSKGKAEDPVAGKAEDPEARTGTGDEALRLELETFDLEMS